MILPPLKCWHFQLLGILEPRKVFVISENVEEMGLIWEPCWSQIKQKKRKLFDLLFYSRHNEGVFSPLCWQTWLLMHCAVSLAEKRWLKKVLLQLVKILKQIILYFLLNTSQNGAEKEYIIIIAEQCKRFLVVTFFFFFFFPWIWILIDAIWHNISLAVLPACSSGTSKIQARL